MQAARSRLSHVRQTAFATVLIGALALAATALADRQQVHLTRTGQKAARAAVLRRGDLGSGSWTGTRKAPALSSSIGCPGFHPKQSDLVVIGAADMEWKSAAAQLDSSAQVLRTKKMVQLDWKRTVRAPQVLPCLRQNVAKSLAATERLSFVTRLPAPAITGRVRLFRTVVVVRAGTARTPILIDSLLIGKGRTEITLTTTALYSSRKSVTRMELRLGRKLADRAG